MDTKCIIAAAAALASLCAFAEGERVNMTVGADRPAAGAPAGARPSFRGRLTCRAGGADTCFVTVEAYFVGRGPAKGAKDVLTGGAVVGRYEFGPGMQPNVDFAIPADLVPQASEDASGGPNELGETAFRGVVVRARIGGETLKVVSVPSVAAWAKAAKEEVVSIGGRKADPVAPPPRKAVDESELSPSDIARGVSAAGGCTTAPFRFSIMWNEDGKHLVDFDAHAVEPSGTEIFFSSHKGAGNETKTGGLLDVDMVRPTETGVENIYWGALDALANGWHRFFVRNYDNGKNKGLKAEVVYGGRRFSYEAKKNVTGDLKVADFETYRGWLARIRHHAPQKAQGGAAR